MNLKINGEIRIVKLEPKQATLTELMKELGHHPKLVVVELNGLIIPKPEWDKKEIKDGDILEIVTIVGGGS